MPCKAPEDRAAYMRSWRADNPEKLSRINRAGYLRHAESRKAEATTYYWDNREDRLAANKAWRQTNPEKCRAIKKAQRERSPLLRLKDGLRRRVLLALKREGARKQDRTFELTGCSPETLRAHISSQFKPGMSWDNHGEWHIDHIRPCSSFNLLDPEQQRACFHYTNLQPLWAVENLKKGSTWTA